MYICMYVYTCMDLGPYIAAIKNLSTAPITSYSSSDALPPGHTTLQPCVGFPTAPCLFCPWSCSTVRRAHSRTMWRAPRERERERLNISTENMLTLFPSLEKRLSDYNALLRFQNTLFTFLKGGGHSFEARSKEPNYIPQTAMVGGSKAQTQSVPEGSTPINFILQA